MAKELPLGKCDFLHNEQTLSFDNWKQIAWNLTFFFTFMPLWIIKKNSNLATLNCREVFLLKEEYLRQEPK